MSLNFAAISPHPPIIVPGVGSPDDLAKAGETIVGLRKLSTSFNEAEIDTLIVISPHFGNTLITDRFKICKNEKLFGAFGQFDHPEIMIEQQNDLDFVQILADRLEKENIAFEEFDQGGEFFELDHAIMVPLFYLKNHQETSFKIVPVSYSHLDRTQHFSFGQVMKEVATEYSGRVGILASGDLSHQLFQNPEGKKFDEQLVEDLKNNKVEDILYYDEESVERAGECGYRSILMLLGALDNIDTKPEILSYEGPFGVGYLVANYNLPEA